MSKKDSDWQKVFSKKDKLKTDDKPEKKMNKHNIILEGDCIELIKQLPDESVDLVIADPPYNLGKDFGNGSDKWDDVINWVDWSKKWIAECKRVLAICKSIYMKLK